MPKGHQRSKQQENLKRKRVSFEEKEQTEIPNEIESVPEELEVEEEEEVLQKVNLENNQKGYKSKKKKGNTVSNVTLLDEPHTFDAAPEQLTENALLQGEEIGEEDEDENTKQSSVPTTAPVIISRRGNKKNSKTTETSTIANTTTTSTKENNDDKMNTEETEEEERRRKIYELFNNMGPMEPFNLKEERSEGHFDEQGNYIWNKNEDNDEPDAWVDDYELISRLDKEMGKSVNATTASSKIYFDVNDTELEKVARIEKKKESSELLSPSLTVDQLRQIQLEILKPGENTIQALKRLGKNCNSGSNHKKPSTVGKKTEESKKGKEKVEVSKTPHSNEIMEIGKDKALLEKLSEVADKLMSLGIANAYHETREDVEEKLEESKQRSANMYEYKWETDDIKVYGPYDKNQIDSWLKQGYQFYMRKANSNEPFKLTE